jgi:hypothetical protein
MIEENSNKVYWWIVCFAIIVVIGVSVAAPVVAKIRAQQTTISTINYSAN